MPRAGGQGLGLQPTVLGSHREGRTCLASNQQSASTHWGPPRGAGQGASSQELLGTTAWESPSWSDRARGLARSWRRGGSRPEGGCAAGRGHCPCEGQRQERAGCVLRMGRSRQTWLGPGCPEQWGRPDAAGRRPAGFSWLPAHTAPRQAARGGLGSQPLSCQLDQSGVRGGGGPAQGVSGLPGPHQAPARCSRREAGSRP